MNQSKLEVITCSWRKAREAMTQLVLVSLLIGWKSGANLLSQSRSVVNAKPITFRHSVENRSNFFQNFQSLPWLLILSPQRYTHYHFTIWVRKKMVLFRGYRTLHVTVLVYLTGLFKKMAEHKELHVFTKVMCNWVNNLLLIQWTQYFCKVLAVFNE